MYSYTGVKLLFFIKFSKHSLSYMLNPGLFMFDYGLARYYSFLATFKSPQIIKTFSFKDFTYLLNNSSYFIRKSSRLSSGYALGV